MKIMKKKIKLKTFLMLISNLIAVIFLLILAIRFYSTAENFIISRKYQIELGNYNHIKLGIDKNINDIQNIAASIINDNKLIEWINENENENFPTTINRKKVIEENVQDLLSYKKETNDTIKCIIVNTDKSQYSSVPVFLLSSKIKESVFNKNYDFDIRFYNGRKLSYNKVNSEGVINNLENEMYFKCSLQKNNINYGDVYIILKDDFFQRLVDYYEDVFILDKNYSFISSDTNRYQIDNNQIKYYNYSDTNFYKEEHYNAYTGSVKFNNWKVIYLADNVAFKNQLTSIKIFILITLAISLFVSIIFSNYISVIVLKPMKTFIRIFKKYNLDGVKLSNNSYKKNKYRISLREKVFYYLLVTVIIPISIFSTLSYIKLNDITLTNIANEYELSFEKTAERISDYFSKKILIFSRLIYGNSAQEYWDSQKEEYAQLFYEDIKLNIYLGLEEDGISIYNNDNNILASNYFSSEASIEQSVFEKLMYSGKKMYWYTKYDKLGKPKIGIGTKVSSFLFNERLKNYVGYAILETNYQNIEELFVGLKNDNTTIFIADKNGRNIFSNGNEDSYLDYSFDQSYGVKRISITDNNKKYFLYYKKLDKAPWYLVVKYNYEDLTHQSNLFINNDIYIFISMFLFIMLLSYYISFNLLKPINNINRIFNSFELDKYNENQIDEYFIDEIDDLRINFNKMIERLEDLFDELLMVKLKKDEVEIEKKHTEIIALQAQINPHFLYNTLDSIIYLIENYKNDKATDIVKALGSLFKFGISRTDTIITIREEIEYAKAYADIISIRNDNNISFEWEVSHQVLKYSTIKLILQPIIENSVYHGIGNMGTNGLIKIECFEKDEDVFFIITDNGKGIDQESLKKIQLDLNSDNIGDRVGIYNVQSRIKLYYSEEYGLNIDSQYGKGTVVKIKIPKELYMIPLQKPRFCCKG